MSKVKVSIVTVVYNEVKHIEQAIQSVINQSYSNIEYIVIDGSSNDGTHNIIELYRDKIHHLVIEPDTGIYEAMNKGIKMSTGEIIGILNSNDWYELTAIEEVVNAYQQHIKMDIFHGLLKYYDLNDIPDSVSAHFPSYLSKGMIEHPVCFIKRSVYKDIGLYDESFKSASDYDFMLKAWKKNISFYFIPVILANYRRGGMSSSFKGAVETIKIQNQHLLISKFKQLALWLYYWFKIKKKFKLLS